MYGHVIKKEESTSQKNALRHSNELTPLLGGAPPSSAERAGQLAR